VTVKLVEVVDTVFSLKLRCASTLWVIVTVPLTLYSSYCRSFLCCLRI